MEWRPSATGWLYHTATMTLCLVDRGLSRARRTSEGYPLLARRAQVVRLRARAITASSIGRVSLPVNVFCWLGW
jgi:hypothetical protein